MHKSNHLPTSFVGKGGHFYVLRNEGLSNPNVPKMYAVYSSINAYNHRSETPFFASIEAVLSDFDHEVSICPETLKTTWPADRDETDSGLTPARNWANRLKKAREGRRYVA